MKIRKAHIEDEVKVIALLGQLRSGQLPTAENAGKWQKVSPTFREIVNNENVGTILVAERDDDIIGVITLSYPVAIRCNGVYSCIEEYVVSEKVRGKGVGGQLLEAAIAEVKSKNCYEIGVNNPSEAGYPVYIRYGFHDSGKHLAKRLS